MPPPNNIEFNKYEALGLNFVSFKMVKKVAVFCAFVIHDIIFILGAYFNFITNANNNLEVA